MSKYKVGFLVNSNANAFCKNAEVIDLVDDYDYSEEEAKEIIGDENKLDDLFKEWLWETIETNYKVLKTDEEIEKWKGLNN
ncbi:hypothetical protein ABVN58_05745 [Fusobacterium polymorphum]|jgi:hypothetical protein F3_00907|uniref:Uncharacterized protein n=1 Tax=Fusobacterium nucleatum CTI-6 TaxID=1316587 RepID=U7TW54_FUSNU|nr:hypothetical protein [Fusobacterium nucleatum]ERT47676.1 hypothetical protein HMPREF1767_01237 [Fusobacterium nucleatum CTI-6]DAT02191.1 MAG TPA: hypothetical protein [Bacteriophage sp.]